MSNSFENFDYSHSALANADSEFTAAFIIYLQMIEQLKMVDEIATTTQSLRAINQAHQIRLSVFALTTDLQRFLSYSALKESGKWSEMTENENAVNFHLAVLTKGLNQ